MSYIGSNPITQYFQEGYDSFTVGATPQSVFALTRPVFSIASIQVFTGAAILAPLPTNYSVSGSTLTLATPVSNLTVTVRYLTASSYATVPSQGTIPVSAINAAGVPSINTFLRGDGTWALPNIPQNLQTAPYTLVASDVGKHVSTSATVTIPASVFNIGDAVSIYNNSTASITITPASGVIAYLAGTASTGSRTLALYGLATLLCVASNTFTVTGQGLA